VKDASGRHLQVRARTGYVKGLPHARD
jgi:hypothetical protein